MANPFTFSSSFNFFKTDDEKDYRGRKIIYKDGQRVFHQPTKRIEDCFQIETVIYQKDFYDSFFKRIISMNFFSHNTETDFIKKNPNLKQLN